MRFALTILLTLVQLILFGYVYKVNYYLHYSQGNWIDTSLNLNEFMPYIFVFYLFTFLMALFYKEEKLFLRILIGIIAICSIYLLFKVNLNPF